MAVLEVVVLEEVISEVAALVEADEAVAEKARAVSFSTKFEFSYSRDVIPLYNNVLGFLP